ncbi:MAG: hypothetical protein KF726_17270 [Anaerolineae bacterium]|nr:hypothetical protein [Anaerolineae bacterium]
MWRQAARNWLHPALVDADLRYLRRQLREQSSASKWLYGIVFVAAYCAGVLPLWIPMIDATHTYILLPLMAFIIYGLTTLLIVRTVILATSVIARHLDSDHWDALVLTTLDAPQIIVSKVWVVMRLVAIDTILAALPRMGIAVGLSQYLFTTAIPNCYSYFGGLCYWNNYPSAMMDIVRVKLMTTAIGFLLIFALMESILIVVISIAAMLQAQLNRLAGYLLAITMRFVLITAVLWSWFAIIPIANSLRPSQAISYAISPLASNMGPCIYGPYGGMCPKDISGIVDSLQVTVSSLADGGMLLITDFTRLTVDANHQLQRLVMIGAGFALYILMIRLALDWAIRLAIRRRALKPIEDEGMTEAFVTSAALPSDR